MTFINEQISKPDTNNINIDPVDIKGYSDKAIKIDMLRLDKIHPVISGNKWFKLTGHLEKFSESDYEGIITFGGAWSNHIVATACTCALMKIKCKGIIRGERPANLSLTLMQAQEYGMELVFIPRQEYTLYRPENGLEKIKNKYPGYYIVPEGGYGAIGENGAAAIMDMFPTQQYSHIAVAMGTGTMCRGIASRLNEEQVLIGIPVLKGWNELKPFLQARIFTDYHFGGYARYNNELISFMNDLYKQASVPTDFVYTGKLCYAVTDLLKRKIIPEKSSVLVIHSGGLQGNASLKKGTLIF